MSIVYKRMNQPTALSSVPTSNKPLSSSLTQQLPSPTLCQTSPSEEDYALAEALMEAHRAETNSWRKGNFTIKEANPVLAKVAKGSVPNATPGLVQALLECKADVSFMRHKSTNIFKKITGKDQDDIPSDVLDQATRNCSSEIVFVLAQKADERSLNQALPVAVMMYDSVKASILLASGADGSKLCTLFLEVVSSGSDDIVDCLLKETRGACQDCRNKALVQVARLGNAPKTKLLLRKGAAVSYDNGAALLEAIRNGREEVAVEIACHPEMRSHPTILDTAVEEAYNREHPRLLEKCLQAGAKGPATERTLVMAVERQQTDIIDILSRNGASATQNGGRALSSAIESGQCDVVKTILQGKPLRSILAASILKAITLPDPQTAYRMVELLIEAGLCGDGVSEMLVHVLDKSTVSGSNQSRRKLLELLLTRGGADVNIGEGEPIAKAIEQEQTELLFLLLQHRPSIDSLSVALTSATNLNNFNQRKEIMENVLNTESFGPLDVADQDRLMQVVMSATSKRLMRQDLDILAGMMPSRASYCAGFAAATSEGLEWLTNEGLEFVSLLLEGGASGTAVDKAFCQAARLYHNDAVDFLAEYASPSAFNEALEGIVSPSKDWLSPENSWLFNNLVEWQVERDCKGESLNLALLAALRAHVKGHDSMNVIDNLLDETVQVDVNYNEGEALKIVIRTGHTLLLEQLIGSGATKATMTEAFITAITAPLEEQQVLDILDVLFSDERGTETSCDVKVTLKTGLSPMATCLSMHPQSDRLIERLASLGCDLETKILCTLCKEKEIGQECVTLLMWALCSHEYNITPAVIATIIKNGADVNFLSSRSNSSSLIVAAKNGRSDIIIKLLLQAKASPIARDCFDKSALFYASQAGDLDSVKELIAANSRKNDGSLHEAARNLHHEIVLALTKAKHEPNFSSRRHSGRNALQELALNCDGTSNMIKLEETLSVLEREKADFLAKWKGKNALFLAFENPQPLPVVTALLDLTQGSLGLEKNIFTELDPCTGNQLCYSPTMYIARDRFKGDVAYRSKLLAILHQAQCPDRYYVKFPPGDFKSLQPVDVVGMPKAIAEEDNKRRIEEEKRRARQMDHDEKLRREREEAGQKAELERLKHSQRLNQQAQIEEQQQQAQERKRAQQEQAAEMKRQSRV